MVVVGAGWTPDCRITDVESVGIPEEDVNTGEGFCVLVVLE